MRATPPKRLVKAIVGASLTFLVMSLIAPALARAGCEHPVDRPSIGLDAFRLDGPKTTTNQVPPPKPCSGPSCSNKSAPPTTSTPQPNPRSELWGLAVEPLPIAGLESSFRVPESALERPVRLATSIFHPPRLTR
jgi:hypothetical protein